MLQRFESFFTIFFTVEMVVMKQHKTYTINQSSLQKLRWILRVCGMLGVLLYISSWFPECGTTPGTGKTLFPDGKNSITILYDEEPASQEKKLPKEPTIPGKESNTSEPPITQERPVAPDSGILPEKPLKEEVSTPEPPPERS